MNLTKKRIQIVVKKIINISVEGTGHCPSEAENDLGDRALKWLDKNTPSVKKVLAAMQSMTFETRVNEIAQACVEVAVAATRGRTYIYESTSFSACLERK